MLQLILLVHFCFVLSTAGSFFKIAVGLNLILAYFDMGNCFHLLVQLFDEHYHSDYGVAGL